MGQEAKKAQRLKDFAGYQVMEALCRAGGANLEVHALSSSEAGRGGRQGSSVCRSCVH